MNVLVTGSNGQLGSEIKELVESNEIFTSLKGKNKILLAKSMNSTCNHANEAPTSSVVNSSHSMLDMESLNFFFTDRDILDITDFKAVNKYIQDKQIKIIINCAAYTAVDKAESDEKNAQLINHLAVKNLAQISKEQNIKLIHISTDYVFDGTNHKPYTEQDRVNPNSVYGKTKLDGEKAMIEINPANSIIIRTSWVYSSYGVNFVKTMLRLGKEKEELGVIFDQVGTPTYARDLAKAILEIIIQKGKVETLLPKNSDNASRSEVSTSPDAKVQIYNYSNEGVLSWYDFAKEIMRMAKLLCYIKPIETKDYPTPAKRPHYSLLNKSKIKSAFDLKIPYWKDSLDECLRKLNERK